MTPTIVKRAMPPPTTASSNNIVFIFISPLLVIECVGEVPFSRVSRQFVFESYLHSLSWAPTRVNYYSHLLVLSYSLNAVHITYIRYDGINVNR